VKRSEKTNGALALLGAAGMYAFFNVLIREMSKMYGDQMQVVARFSVALLLLLLFHIYKNRLPSIPKDKIINVIGLGLSSALLVLLITVSVNSTKIANSIFLLYAGSILGAFILGTFIFKETITKVKIASITLAMAGIAIFLIDSGAIEVGLITAFVAGCFDSISNTIRKSVKTVDRNSLLVYQYSIMVIVAIIMTFVFNNETVKTINFGGIATTVFYGFLLVTLGNLLLYGFQHFDVNIGTVILASELFFALLFGYIFFRESPTLLELLGGIVVFAASGVAVLGAKKHTATNDST